MLCIWRCLWCHSADSRDCSLLCLVDGRRIDLYDCSQREYTGTYHGKFSYLHRKQSSRFLGCSSFNNCSGSSLFFHSSFSYDCIKKYVGKQICSCHTSRCETLYDWNYICDRNVYDIDKYGTSWGEKYRYPCIANHIVFVPFKDRKSTRLNSSHANIS